jgi:hypothetical protein
VHALDGRRIDVAQELNEFRSDEGREIVRLRVALKKARSILDSEYPESDERHPEHWLDKILNNAET